jgi:hypothetical protein
MKQYKIMFIVMTVCSIFSLAAIASAGDFDWLKDLNIQAQADPSGFKATLGARFKIGDTEINAVLSNVKDPADAYMVLRLGEMSSKPTGYVVEQYSSGKNKGWGALSKSLGIKPGSQEFDALKRGHDLKYGNAEGDDQNKGAKKNKGKGKS